MKAINALFPFFGILLMLTTIFPACDTESINPDDSLVPIYALNEDLLDYFFTIELEGATNNLYLLYFQKQEEGSIMGILDGVTSRRGRVINFEDSIFNFDIIGDKRFVLTFKISKDNTDNLNLLDYGFQSSDQNIKLRYSQMNSVHEVKEFKGLTYYMKDTFNPNFPVAGIYTYYLNFPDKDQFKWTNDQNFDKYKPSSCYTISPGAWKGKDIYTDVDFMGVSVPKWKDEDKNVMILTNKETNKLEIYDLF